MLNISVIVLTYNEERCIERCLNSIKNIFNEIVIVDTGSNDRTLEILKKTKIENMNIFNFDWNDNFSEIRNFALKQATFEWIFYIDADEVLEIVSLNDLQNEFAMMSMDEENKYITYCPQIIDESGHITLGMHRIFKKNSKFSWHGNIHEEIRNENKFVVSKPVCINIRHDGYIKEILIKKNKIERNISLLEKMIKIEPFNLRWQFFLVRDSFMKLEKLQSKKIIQELIDKYEEQTFLSSEDGNRLYYLHILLVSLSLDDENFSIDLLEKLDSLVPDNSDVIYFKYVKIIIDMRKDMKNHIQDLVYLREKITNNNFSSIHTNHSHLDFLLCIMLNVIGERQLAEKHFQILKTKFIDDYLIKLFKIDLDF